MTRNIKSGDTNGENPHITSCKNSTAIYFTSIIVIVLASSFLIQISSVAPSEALTRYYNCIARVANKNATLSIANVDACYNLIFKGALDYMVLNNSQRSIIKILLLRKIQRRVQKAIKGNQTVLTLNSI